MPNDLKSIKHYLREQGVLRLDENFKLTEKNPTDFVRNYMLSYYKKFDSYDVENNVIQTYANRSRSASDIFRITYHYFPKVKLITIYRVIFALLKEGKIGTDICSTVEKRVYWACSYPDKNEIMFYGAHTDETDLDFTSIPEFEGIKSKDSGSSNGLLYFPIPKI